MNNYEFALYSASHEAQIAAAKILIETDAVLKSGVPDVVNTSEVVFDYLGHQYRAKTLVTSNLTPRT
jgi:hypothetical protein